MLKEIVNNTLILICNTCKTENQHDVSTFESTFLEEYNEYENVSFPCSNCSSVEVFNMNIPVDDTDEPFSTGDLPVNEEIQRAYVRLLMRIVREDFKK